MSHAKALFASILATIAVLATSGTAYADYPPYVYVRDVTFNGSGCPDGSVEAHLTNDGQSLVLIFSQFEAEAGPDIPRSSNRRFCQLNIDLAFPSGWSFSIADVDYRGFVSLDSRVKGRQQSTYYFQGEDPIDDLVAYVEFTGPYEDDYSRRDSLLLTHWSRCSDERPLNIKTEVRIDNRRNRYGTGYMTVDTIDFVVTQIYGLRWRRC